MSEDLLRVSRQLLDELEVTALYLRTTAAQSLSYRSLLKMERRAARRCAEILAMSGNQAFELPQDDATDELLAGAIRRRDPAFNRQTTATQLFGSTTFGRASAEGDGRYEPFDDGPEGAADATADLRSEESLPPSFGGSSNGPPELLALPPIELPSGGSDEVDDEDTSETIKQAEQQRAAAPRAATAEPSYVSFEEPEKPGRAEVLAYGVAGVEEDGLEELELDDGPDTFDLVPEVPPPPVAVPRTPVPAVSRAGVFPSIAPTIRDADAPPRPRAAAIQINASGSGGKVLGLEEEEEPIEIGAAEDEVEGGEVDLAEGFAVSMQPAEELELEVDESDEDDEEEEEDDEVIEPLAAATPAAPTTDEIEALLSQARQSATEGRLQQGADLFSDVIDADPNNVDAHVARGRLYLDLGDYSRAMSDFMLAEDLAPNSPEPQVGIGDLYFARKDYRKAIDYFNAAIEVSPNHAMAYCRRGISHYYRKNFREAVDDLLQAERIDADIPNIQTYVAMARKKIKK